MNRNVILSDPLDESGDAVFWDGSRKTARFGGLRTLRAFRGFKKRERWFAGVFVFTALLMTVFVPSQPPFEKSTAVHGRGNLSDIYFNFMTMLVHFGWLDVPLVLAVVLLFLVCTTPPLRPDVSGPEVGLAEALSVAESNSLYTSWMGQRWQLVLVVLALFLFPVADFAVAVLFFSPPALGVNLSGDIFFGILVGYGLHLLLVANPVEFKEVVAQIRQQQESETIQKVAI